MIRQIGQADLGSGKFRPTERRKSSLRLFKFMNHTMILAPLGTDAFLVMYNIKDAVSLRFFSAVSSINVELRP